MPPKKVKHGGVRENGGRQAQTGEYSKDKTPEEKRKSLRERMAKVRGQQKVSEGRIVVDSDGVDKEAFESFKFKPGRPSLDPVAGAMRVAVQAEYKLENQRQNRKKQKINAIGQAAVASRKTGEVGTWRNCLEKVQKSRQWTLIWKK